MYEFSMVCFFLVVRSSSTNDSMERFVVFRWHLRTELLCACSSAQSEAKESETDSGRSKVLYYC
jgi:hypothetical protein